MFMWCLLDTKAAFSCSSDPTPKCPQEAVQIAISPEALNTKDFLWLSCDQEVKLRKCTLGGCSGEAISAGLFKFIGKSRYISHREGKQYVTTKLKAIVLMIFLESYITLSSSSYLVLASVPTAHTFPLPGSDTSCTSTTKQKAQQTTQCF